MLMSYTDIKHILHPIVAHCYCLVTVKSPKTDVTKEEPEGQSHAVTYPLS